MTTIQSVGGFKVKGGTRIFCRLCRFEVSTAEARVAPHMAAAEAHARSALGEGADLAVLDAALTRRRQRDDGADAAAPNALLLQYDALLDQDLARRIGQDGEQTVSRSREPVTSWSDGSGSRMATHMSARHGIAVGPTQLQRLKAHPACAAHRDAAAQPTFQQAVASAAHAAAADGGGRSLKAFFDSMTTEQRWILSLVTG